ncbi:hypothetical protein Tco_1145884 [Tanacetum coccineum]
MNMVVHVNDASESWKPSWGKIVYIRDLVDFDVTASTSRGKSKLEYKFQDKENSEDIFSFGSALEDFISVVMCNMIGTCLVAYNLDLPEELNGVHDTFHVSNLKNCLADPTLQVPFDEIQVDAKLNFIEEPMEILEREFKNLKRSLEVGAIRRIQVLDMAYWGFLGVGTTLDIFQNIILIPYLEYGVLSLSRYGVLSFILLWSLVSAGTDTPYLP